MCIPRIHTHSHVTWSAVVIHTLMHTSRKIAHIDKGYMPIYSTFLFLICRLLWPRPMERAETIKV